MSFERPVPSSSSSTEIAEVIFPEEIWIIIWSYLDFNTVQKTCTCVSKSWFEMIRSSKLSWEMKIGLHTDMLEVKDFNAILFQWYDLRELHFSSELDFAKFHLSLNSKKSLKKVVVPSHIDFDTNGSDFNHPLRGWVTKYCIDPKNLITPTDIVKNVIELNVYMERLPEEFSMKKNNCDFTNLHTLVIRENNNEGLSSEIVVPFLLRFKELKKLIIRHLEIHINYLLDILRFLADMKNLKISVSLGVVNDFDEEATKHIFHKALEIVNDKFPFPDGRILKLEIFEYNGNRQPGYSIIYPTFTDDVDMSDSETDSSDSETDTSDSENDSTDFMDESNECSDAYDESVENLDAEDINAQE